MQSSYNPLDQTLRTIWNGATVYCVESNASSLKNAEKNYAEFLSKSGHTIYSYLLSRPWIHQSNEKLQKFLAALKKNGYTHPAFFPDAKVHSPPLQPNPAPQVQLTKAQQHYRWGCAAYLRKDAEKARRHLHGAVNLGCPFSYSMLEMMLQLSKDDRERFSLSCGDRKLFSLSEKSQKAISKLLSNKVEKNSLKQVMKDVNALDSSDDEDEVTVAKCNNVVLQHQWFAGMHNRLDLVKSKKSDSGDDEDEINTANCIEEELIISVQEREALFINSRDQAAQGNLLALSTLAQCYVFGVGTPKNLQAAFNTYLQFLHQAGYFDDNYGNIRDEISAHDPQYVAARARYKEAMDKSDIVAFRDCVDSLPFYEPFSGVSGVPYIPLQHIAEDHDLFSYLVTREYKQPELLKEFLCELAREGCYHPAIPPEALGVEVTAENSQAYEVAKALDGVTPKDITRVVIGYLHQRGNNLLFWQKYYPAPAKQVATATVQLLPDVVPQNDIRRPAKFSS